MTKRRATRVTNVDPNLRLRGGLLDLLSPPPLRFVQDDRTWNPNASPYEPSRTLFGNPGRVTVYPTRQKPVNGRPADLYWPSTEIGYHKPDQVVTCVRRQQRREVLHAKGKAGGKVRRNPRSPKSNVRCR